LLVTWEIGPQAASADLRMTGSISRTVSSRVSVPSGVWVAGGAAAAAAAAVEAAALPGSALSAAVAAAAGDLTAATAAAARAILGDLQSAALQSALTEAAAGALESEGAAARAALVRSLGVAVNGVTASAPATASPAEAGALAAPALAAATERPSFFSDYLYTAAAAGVATLAAVILFARWRRAARAADAERLRGDVMPLALNPLYQRTLSRGREKQPPAPVSKPPRHVRLSFSEWASRQ
jgi:hypothetical protein